MDEKLICFTKDELLKPREIVAEIMEYMIKTGLTDFSGGNMALRVDDKVYSTQTHAADKYRWKLRPDDIIVTDLERNFLEGRKEKISREADLHYMILKRFPDINCTLHGNTFYSPLIVSSGIKPVALTQTAQSHNIGKIAVVPEEIKTMTQEEFEYVISVFEELKRKNEALVIIMPYHGIMVAAEDHNEAFALVDAVEDNSKFIYSKEKLDNGRLVKRVFEELSNNVRVQDKTAEKEISNPDRIENVLTVEDIENNKGIISSNIIRVSENCIITALASAKADELGIKIIRQ